MGEERNYLGMILDHYSYSSYSLYNRCPREFYLVKSEIQPKRETAAMSFGKRYHESVENYHKGNEYDAKLIKEYTDKFPQDYFAPDSVEIPFRVKFMDTEKAVVIDTPFEGFLDGRNSLGIQDLKTFSKPMEQEELAENGQATLYVYANYLITGEIVPFYFNVFLKKMKTIVTYKTERNMGDFERLFWKLHQFDMMVREDYFPCTCGRCDA